VTDVSKSTAVSSLCLALCALLFALSISAEAQPRAKVPKIGWLSPGSAALVTRFESFRREFRKIGYLEGENVAFE
jgi:hypothetical protein